MKNGKGKMEMEHTSELQEHWDRRDISSGGLLNKLPTTVIVHFIFLYGRTD